MKILLCPDKFKGSLTAMEICELLKDEISLHLPQASFDICPMADGGEGSLEILSQNLEMDEITTQTVDALGRPILASYYSFENCAYIELANTSGLVQLEPRERNPMITSTYGTGIQIRDAIEKGFEKIYLFIGGSATNDGGIGIAKALGFQFFDRRNNELDANGESLSEIFRLEFSKGSIDLPKIIVCSDVRNPPFGTDGAAHVYAAQKGASKADIERLDQGLINLCHQLQLFSGIDCSLLAGGGAAGGVGISLTALFGAEIKSGMAMISEILDLEEKIKKADIVISGEGKLDRQSLQGKVVSGVINLSRDHDKITMLVVGQNALSRIETLELNINNVHSIMDYAQDLEDAMSNGKKYIREIGRRIALDLKEDL